MVRSSNDANLPSSIFKALLDLETAAEGMLQHKSAIGFSDDEEGDEEGEGSIAKMQKMRKKKIMQSLLWDGLLRDGRQPWTFQRLNGQLQRPLESRLS